jgi:XTP/dITP diphosphohydrolase
MRLAADRRPLLLATRSAGKIRELRAMFAEAGMEVTDLNAVGVPESSAEDDLEIGSTYEENALAKARHFHRVTGLPTVADDSGIEVAALGGAPGVHSKRWSGVPLTGEALDRANNELLLRRLGDTENRAARYVCVAAYCDSNEEFVERGETRGRVTRLPRGTGGFGYDPYFESDEIGCTFGEITMTEKARVSHRARAFGRLLQRLSSAPVR